MLGGCSISVLWGLTCWCIIAQSNWYSSICLLCFYTKVIVFHQYSLILLLLRLAVLSESCTVVSDSLHPHGLCSPWNSPGQNTGVGSFFLLQGNLPNPGIEPRSPALQVDSLPAESQGKPENSGMGCCFLLQGNLPNPGIESGCSASQADSLLSEPPEKSGLP